MIRFHMFQNRPSQNVKFLGYLINHMEIMMDGQVVLLTVSKQLLMEFGVAYEDLDEYISYVRDIAGIELAVILKEINKNEVKISFRSKSWLNVNELAAQLNGGGHERAAGAIYQGSLEDTHEVLMPFIQQSLHGGQKP